MKLEITYTPEIKNPCGNCGLGVSPHNRDWTITIEGRNYSMWVCSNRLVRGLIREITEENK